MKKLFAAIISALVMTFGFTIQPAYALDLFNVGGAVAHSASSERSSLLLCTRWSNGYCSGYRTYLARNTYSKRYFQDIDAYYIPGGCWGYTPYGKYLGAGPRWNLVGDWSQINVKLVCR